MDMSKLTINRKKTAEALELGKNRVVGVFSEKNSRLSSHSDYKVDMQAFLL